MHLNLTPAAQPDRAHQQLTHTLHAILTRRANPENPSFPVTRLVTDLNQVLSDRNKFQLGTQQCALEFLVRLIENINVTPNFFTCFHEEAKCQVCNSVNRRRIQQESDTLLCLTPPHQDHHIDLFTVVHTRLITPITDMVCTAPNTACHGRQALGFVQDQVGQNTIVWLCRNTGVASKCLTPVLEPVPSQRWNGQECRAVVAHCGRTVAHGHWLAFLKVGHLWWRVDTSTPNPIIENPFRGQMVPGRYDGGSEYTIDGFVLN